MSPTSAVQRQHNTALRLIVLFGVCVGWSLSRKLQTANVIVLGKAGGVSEAITNNLVRAGLCTAAVFNRIPLTEQLKDIAAIDTAGLRGVVQKQLSTVRDSSSKKTVLVTSFENTDGGDEELVQDMLAHYGSHILPMVSCSMLVIDEQAWSKWGSTRAGKVFKSTSTQQLIIRSAPMSGYLPDQYPEPFLSLPLREPELHPFYTMRAASITRSSQNQDEDASVVCTYDAAAECVTQVVRMIQAGKLPMRNLDKRELYLSSTRGPAPSEEDWQSMLTSVLAPGVGGDVLLNVEFAEVMKPDALISWLCDTWYPQAVGQTGLAEIVCGARPVRIVRSSSHATILYETLRDDLTVVPAGQISLQLKLPNGGSGSGSATRPSVVMSRSGGGAMLPGETALAQHLAGAIKATVYKRQMCRELKLRASIR